MGMQRSGKGAAAYEAHFPAQSPGKATPRRKRRERTALSLRFPHETAAPSSGFSGRLGWPDGLPAQKNGFKARRQGAEQRALPN